MVRSWVLVALYGLSALVGASCEKKPNPSTGSASNAGVITEAAPTPEPIPLEPPVEVVRVPDSGLPCAVDELLAKKCRRCHTIPARHNAPFALLTWEDTQAPMGDRKRYEVMGGAVKSGYMPYNIPANPPVERLTDAEKQIIVDWVEAGAQRSTCGSARPAGSGLPRTVNSADHGQPKRRTSLQGTRAFCVILEDDDLASEFRGLCRCAVGWLPPRFVRKEHRSGAHSGVRLRGEQ